MSSAVAASKAQERAVPRESARPAIYTGWMRHRRFATSRNPVPHEFEYPMFMPFLDVDRIPELMRASSFTSHNRWNWATFADRDHLGDPAQSFRERLKTDASRHGIELPAGKIFLLTHLRYLGYNFNPVSFFYCYDEQDQLAMVMAEVNNTFGETHNYWLTGQVETVGSHPGRSRQYRFTKQFHVSPFLQMGHDYEWTFGAPGETLVVQTNSFEHGERIFDATVRMERREWCAAEIRRALLRFPWHTARVITAIHWQAIRLWGKRVPVVHHPGPGQFEPSRTKHLGANWSNV